MFNIPVTIRSMTLHNRLVMPPMATAKSAPDGVPTQELTDYYDEKSKGGFIGLIITEHAYVEAAGKFSAGQLSLADDSVIEPLRTLTSVIHANGSAVMAQLAHAGGRAAGNLTCLPAYAPAAVRLPNQKPDTLLPTAMTTDDIRRVVEAFADAARRAVAAGYDGVEIHSAHGYLLNQFYSPLSNCRTDAYGGSLENRIRIHGEVIAAIRKAIGPDVPVAIRLGGCDYTDGGSTIENAVRACRQFEAWGVDLLDLSGGFCGYNVPALQGQGYFREMTHAVKDVVHVPVLLTGGITEPAVAEELLQNGDSDLIGVGRAILKDGSWPERAVKALSK